MHLWSPRHPPHSVHGPYAKVYVNQSPAAPAAKSAEGAARGPRTAPPGAGGGAALKYYFNIGSLDSFERKMEEAQELLGIDPHEYVPVGGWHLSLTCGIIPTVHSLTCGI